MGTHNGRFVGASEFRNESDSDSAPAESGTSRHLAAAPAPRSSL